MAFDNLFFKVDRSIGGVALDGVIEEVHDNSIRLTQNPIENGVDITDHAIVLPKKLRVRAVVTDTPLRSAALTQIVDNITGLFGTSTSGNVTRSVNGYNAMVALMESREPITVVTRLVTYNDMLITSVGTSQDKDTSRAAFLNMELEQVVITSSEISATSSDNLAPDGTRRNASPEVNKGRQPNTETPEPERTSILEHLLG